MAPTTKNGQEPFESEEQREIEETAGKFVGFVPDAIQRLLKKMRKDYELMEKQQVRLLKAERERHCACQMFSRPMNDLYSIHRIV